MNWLGDYPEDFATIAIFFTTHDSNGAPVAPLTAFETADFAIYKNGSATQKTTTNGLTIASPFDSVVGLHCLLIDSSNDTGDSGFWTTGGGSVYSVLLNPDTETVNGQVPLKIIGSFGILLTSVTIAAASIRSAIGLASANLDTQLAAIQSDTDDIQTRLPAALVSGRIDASVGAMAANVITTAAINDNAITDAKVAADVTIASVTGAVGSVTGAVGSVTGLTASDVGAIKTKTDFLPSATAGAAGGVFIAGTNAATTVTTSFTTTFTGSLTGSVGSVTGAVGSVTGAVGSVTGNVGGNVTGSVGSVASGGITAASLAADTITAAKVAADVGTEIGTAVWVTTTRELTSGTNIVLAKGTGVTGFNDLSAAQVNAEADTALSDVGLTGTVTGRIDAAVSTRASQNSVDTIDDFVDTEVAAIKAKTDQLTFTTANRVDSQVFGMQSGTVTAAAIATDAIDADALAADAVTEIQSGLSSLTAAGVRAAVGLATANLDTQLDALPTNAELAAALGTADDATLAAIAALNNLSAAQVNTEVDTALADVGLTTTITGRIDAAISTRLPTSGYTAPANATIAAIDAKTTNLPSDPADQSLLIAATDALVTLVADIPTNAELATALGAADDAVLAAIAALTIPSAAANAAALLAAAFEDAETVQDFLRLSRAALYGVAADQETSAPKFKSADGGTTRIEVTGADENGNRPVVVLDAT